MISRDQSPGFMLYEFIIHAQQTRNVQQMLVQCLASVEDDGQTLYHNWFNVSCLQGDSGATKPHNNPE